MKKSLLKKIKAKQCKIAVIGLGHIGLPMATLIANVGYNVTGVDVNPNVIKDISNYQSPLKEPGLEDLICQNINGNKLHVTTNLNEAILDSDIIIVCVPTPLTKGKPDLNYLKKVCLEIGFVLKKGQLIIIGSTTPPNTIGKFVLPLIEKTSNLKTGIDFWLAYCPERISSGSALKEFIENDRIIGGEDKNSIKMATLLFKTIINGKIYSTNLVTAEVVKLTENAFRDVNIAFSNELALLCEKIGCDVKEVINLANSHQRVIIHQPGPGVGGPCLTKDPLLLLNPIKSKKISSKIIENSRLINEKMPMHIVKLIIKSLHQVSKSVEKSQIAILGVTYKADIDDSRYTPSKLVIEKLIKLKSRVKVHDPYCRESFGAILSKSISIAVNKADCLVIMTDHKKFKEINLKKIKNLMNSRPIIIDARRILDPLKSEKQGFIYYGIGFR